MRARLAPVLLAVVLVACSTSRVPKPSASTSTTDAANLGLGKAPRSDETNDDAEAAKGVAPAAGIVDLTTSPHCGYERWAVKTGQDPNAGAVALAPRPSTIADLSLIPSPLPKVPAGHFPPQVRRQQAEEQTYSISATLIAYRVEADSDIHLVISDGKGHTMITEIPDPACMGASPWIPQVTAARNAFLARTGYKPMPWSSKTRPPKFVKARLPVSLAGVAFFDFPHSQYGAAPTNAVELHPLLAFSSP